MDEQARQRHDDSAEDWFDFDRPAAGEPMPGQQRELHSPRGDGASGQDLSNAAVVLMVITIAAGACVMLLAGSLSASALASSALAVGYAAFAAITLSAASALAIWTWTMARGSASGNQRLLVAAGSVAMLALHAAFLLWAIA